DDQPDLPPLRSRAESGPPESRITPHAASLASPRAPQAAAHAPTGAGLGSIAKGVSPDRGLPDPAAPQQMRPEPMVPETGPPDRPRRWWNSLWAWATASGWCVSSSSESTSLAAPSQVAS